MVCTGRGQGSSLPLELVLTALQREPCCIGSGHLGVTMHVASFTSSVQTPPGLTVE